LSKILNLFFNAPKAFLIVTLSEECLRLNNYLALVGRFLLPYSDKWYLTPCRKGGIYCNIHILHLQGRIYLQVHQRVSNVNVCAMVRT
jgi:hypothetical protein